MSELVYSCMSKTTRDEGDQLRHSHNWLISRRAMLRVTTDALECGDWKIPYDKIEEAILFRTSQMFIPCYLLKVKSRGTTYQFGLNPGRYWAGELPFSVRRERVRLGYSTFSILVRLFLVASLAYWIWTIW